MRLKHTQMSHGVAHGSNAKEILSRLTTLNSPHLGSSKPDAPDVKSWRAMSWGGGWSWGHSSWDHDSSWDWRNDGWQSWSWDGSWSETPEADKPEPDPEDLGSYTYLGSCNKSNGALPCQKQVEVLSALLAKVAPSTRKPSKLSMHQWSPVALSSVWWLLCRILDCKWGLPTNFDFVVKFAGF